MVKIKDFCVKNLKMKRGQKFLDLPERGFEPQIFSNFSAHDLNLNLNSYVEFNIVHIKSRKQLKLLHLMPPQHGNV